MDELEEAQVLQVKAQAVQGLTSVLSGEELRGLLGYEGDIPLEETVAGQQQAQQLEASKELGRGLQAAGGASTGITDKPSMPSEPSRADAYAAIDRGDFPEFVRFWEGMGFSKNRQIKLCRMGRSTFYENLKQQESRQIDIQL